MKKHNNVALKLSALDIELLGQGKFLGIVKKLPSPDLAGSKGKHREFFMFPLYDNIDGNTVRQEWHETMNNALAQKKDGMARFQYYAQLRASIHLTNMSRLGVLEEYSPYEWDNLQSQFTKSPVGLHFLVVRVFTLAESLMMVDRPMYDGSSHWVELETPLPTKGLNPVLSMAEFEDRVANLRDRLDVE